MLCTLLRCLTIVAVFQLHVAGVEAVSADVPISAPTVDGARALGLDPVRDRARFLSEFIRLLYTRPPRQSAELDVLALDLNRTNPALPSEGSLVVPVPLDAATWSRIVFKREVPADGLVAAIVSDRRAALLAYGLAALDDETLAFLESDPAILPRVYQFSAPAFAAFGASLRIQSGRVVPPGGDAAVPLWEALVGQRVDAPSFFVPALFGLHLGRLAYLYDLIAQLDRPKAAFALGLWMPDEFARRARFAALSLVATGAYPEWQVDLQPFSKPLYDLSFLLMRIRVSPGGAPLEPASQAFWSAVFANDDPSELLPAMPDAGLDAPIDAAWLAGATSFSHSYSRSDRLDQIAFGQRVFADAAREGWGDVFTAVRAFRRQRMLMLTLERIGVTAPAVYASVARPMSRFSVRDTNRAFWALAQLQGALALIARMTEVGTLDASSAGELFTSLCAVPLDDERYAGALAEWLEHHLLPRLPEGDGVEARLIAGLAGPSDPRLPRVFWEGQQYRLDLPHAEVRRLQVVRGKQASYTVDAALALARIAQQLSTDRVSVQDARAAAAALFTFSQEFALTLNRPPPEVLASGVRPAPRANELVQRAVGDLTAIATGRDVRRIPRVAAQLTDLVDGVLGEALLSLAYAVDIGDPDGTALLARNIALRHDFGLGHQDLTTRGRLSWAIPRQDTRLGVAWHVAGSLLGLNVALAPLSLRRLSGDAVGNVPRLPPIERDAFSVAVALMDPRRLRDEDRDAIALAVARGRQRVNALEDGEPFEAAADAAGLDGRRRRAIRWMLHHDRAGLPSMFSLVDLLVLGGGAPGADLDAWGMTALVLSSCPCTELVRPKDWHLLDGRPQLGLMASAMSDLNLRVAVMLHELDVPAALAQPVLEAAVQEFIESVAPTDANDWWTLARTAQALPRERIEDYVATAAAVGGPLVLDEPEEAFQP